MPELGGKARERERKEVNRARTRRESQRKGTKRDQSCPNSAEMPEKGNEKRSIVPELGGKARERGRKEPIVLKLNRKID
ncbi:hypothetical protein GCM10009865_38200 [Aeromicrobium ponti]